MELDMNVHFTGATLALAAIGSLAAAAARRSRATASSGSANEGEPQDLGDIRPHELIEEEMRAKGIPNVGLNADWSVSAWVVGKTPSITRSRLTGREYPTGIDGHPVYLLDNEDDTYSAVLRFYSLGEDGAEDVNGQPMPAEYEPWHDGMNDVIIELKSWNVGTHAEARSMLEEALTEWKRLSQDQPQPHPALGRRQL
jgi:hypothetical protein